MRHAVRRAVRRAVRHAVWHAVWHAQDGDFFKLDPVRPANDLLNGEAEPEPRGSWGALRRGHRRQSSSASNSLRTRAVLRRVHAELLARKAA